MWLGLMGYHFSTKMIVYQCHKHGTKARQVQSIMVWVTRLALGWHCIQPPSKHHYPHLIRPGSAPAHQTCLGICSQWSGVNIVHTLALPSGLGSRLLAKLSYKLLYCLFKLFTLPSFASFSLLFAEVHHTLIVSQL